VKTREVVHLSNGRTLEGDEVKTTFKQDGGWLTVQFTDGRFYDYPPHAVESVHRYPEEE